MCGVDCLGVGGAKSGLGGAVVDGGNRGLDCLVAPAVDDRKPCT